MPPVAALLAPYIWDCEPRTAIERSCPSDYSWSAGCPD